MKRRTLGSHRPGQRSKVLNNGDKGERLGGDMSMFVYKAFEDDFDDDCCRLRFLFWRWWWVLDVRIDFSILVVPPPPCRALPYQDKSAVTRLNQERF